MLLVISEKESYSHAALEHVFRETLKISTTDIYVLVVPETTQPNVSVLLDQLVTIYDTSFQVKDELKIYPETTVILYEQLYDPKVAAKLWSSVAYSSSLNVEVIPRCYVEHVDEKNIAVVGSVRDTDIGSDVSHKKYKLANREAPGNSIAVVAVGGTFDHLHDGHQILLTVAAFLAKTTLIIGVTGHELLKNKKYVEYMESYDKRVQNVRVLLNAVKPSLIPEIYEINDVCGPTAKIENIDALVVSLESLKGADFVNDTRHGLGWPKLDVYTIGVLGSSDPETFKNKLSSTDYRKMEYLKANHLGENM